MKVNIYYKEISGLDLQMAWLNYISIDNKYMQYKPLKLLIFFSQTKKYNSLWLHDKTATQNYNKVPAHSKVSCFKLKITLALLLATLYKNWCKLSFVFSRTELRSQESKFGKHKYGKTSIIWLYLLTKTVLSKLVPTFDLTMQVNSKHTLIYPNPQLSNSMPPHTSDNHSPTV